MSIVVIGGGVSGLVAAINLKNRLPDKEIILIEKNSVLGGRLYSEEIIINNDKYTIDYGPSWCWMPKIIKKVLKELDINTKNLKFERLDPQYKIIYYDKKDEARVLIQKGLDIDPESITGHKLLLQVMPPKEIRNNLDSIFSPNKL